VEAKKSKDACDALLTMPLEKRKQLVKYLKAVLGKKQPKSVSLSDFKPKSPVILVESEIEDAVTEFRKYLNKQWQEGYYLKLEK